MSWARNSTIDRTKPELAPTLTAEVVRTVAALAIGVNIALSLIDAWRTMNVPVEPHARMAAALGVAIAIPLHIRHVIYGLRGLRPPGGVWTLALLAIVHAVTFSFVGALWVFQFSGLAVSVLIIVPGAAGLALAAAVALSPLTLVDPYWFAPTPHLGGIYLAFSITWRATTQFVPLRLLAAIRALEMAGRELESRAVVQARVRIDAELQDGVAGALEKIVARGDAIRRTIQNDQAAAIAELGVLVNESRRTLTSARRVVAGYRGSSVRAELDAATALLEASGATVEISIAEGLALDSPDEHARRAIRSAVGRALRDEPNASYHVDVTRDDTGTIRVLVSPTSPRTAEGVA
jgi:two-component system sensor histidine kinase DesK